MIRLFRRISVVEPQIDRQIRPDVTEKSSIAESRQSAQKVPQADTDLIAPFDQTRGELA
jgi:hypothetical protein